MESAGREPVRLGWSRWFLLQSIKTANLKQKSVSLTYLAQLFLVIDASLPESSLTLLLMFKKVLLHPCQKSPSWRLFRSVLTGS